MPTPAQHVTTATSLLISVLSAARPLTASAAELDLVAAHGLLGKSAGSGSAYGAAEACIADCDAWVNDGGRTESYRQQARAARAWAQLAT